MLKGKIVTLRPLQEEDLPQIYTYNLDLDNRGEFFSRSIRTMTEMRKDLNTNGLWTPGFGVLALIDNESGKLVGQIAYYDTVRYMDELEIGYILYEQSKRRKGSMSEALRLLTRYLFDTRPLNRIRLCIATENAASRGVAKNGGYAHEATQRGAAYRNNRDYNVELYAIVRGDLEREGY